MSCGKTPGLQAQETAQPVEGDFLLRAVRLHHDASAVMQADHQPPCHILSGRALIDNQPSLRLSYSPSPAEFSLFPRTTDTGLISRTRGGITRPLNRDMHLHRRLLPNAMFTASAQKRMKRKHSIYSARPLNRDSRMLNIILGTVISMVEASKKMKPRRRYGCAMPLHKVKNGL